MNERLSSTMQLKDEIEIQSLKDTGIVNEDMSIFSAVYSFRGILRTAKLKAKNLSIDVAKIQIACMYAF